jgi:hypothetical protein
MDAVKSDVDDSLVCEFCRQAFATAAELDGHDCPALGEDDDSINLRRKDGSSFNPREDPQSYLIERLFTTDYPLELLNEDDSILDELDLSDQGKLFLKQMILYVKTKDAKFGNLDNAVMNDIFSIFKINWVKGFSMLPRSDQRNQIFSMVLRFLEATLKTELTRASGPERLDILSRTIFVNKHQSQHYSENTGQVQAGGFWNNIQQNNNDRRQ